jgi:hypothetical protein
MAVKITDPPAVNETTYQCAGELHLKMRSRTFKVGFSACHKHGADYALLSANKQAWKVTYAPEPALATLWQLEGRTPYGELTLKLRTAFRSYLKENGLLGQIKKLWAKEFPTGPSWEFHGLSHFHLRMNTSLHDVPICFSAYITNYNSPANPISAHMSDPAYKNFDFSTPKGAVEKMKYEYEAAVELIEDTMKNDPDFFVRAAEIKKQLGPGVIVQHSLHRQIRAVEHTDYRWKSPSGEIQFRIKADGSMVTYQGLIDSRKIDSLGKACKVLDFFRSMDKTNDKETSQEMTP